MFMGVIDDDEHIGYPDLTEAKKLECLKGSFSSSPSFSM